MKYKVWTEKLGEKAGFTVTGKTQVECQKKADKKIEKLGWVLIGDTLRSKEVEA